MLGQLRESERWPSEQVEELQFDALGRLLRHAVATVPYYRDRPGYAGAPANAESWRQLPVLTRAEVQEAGAALHSDATPADHAPFYETITSGSTGRPVRAVGTRVTAAMWQAITLRDLAWHPRDVTGKLASIRAEGSDSMPVEGRMLPGWGPPTDVVYDTGACALFSVQHDVATQAEWLVRQQPDYVLSYPSNLVALAQHFQSSRTSLPALRGVTTYGEVLVPEARDECRRAWGVEVVDMYSSQEIGYIALQCPQSERYHVQSEAVYVEVLNDAGAACGPGEVGRVVVSTLHNFAMPLLRYEVGDFAEVGGGCPCGRTLPVLERVLGRQRNMLALPGGRKVWPTFPAKSWSHIEAIRQLQLAQLGPDHIEVRVVGPRPLNAGEQTEFVSMVQTRLGHPFHVSFDYRTEIERGEGGKFEDFVCLVAD